MHKRKIAFFITIFLFTSCFTSGCWNRAEVSSWAEAAGLVFDLQDGKPVYSIQLYGAAKPDESGGANPQPYNFTETGGRTFVEADRRAMLKLPRVPLLVHIGTILIGRDLAHSDIAGVADYMARNRNIRETALIFVSKNVTGRECLDAETPLETFSMVGIKKMIQAQERYIGIYTPVNLTEFMEKLVTPGIEPVVPQVSVYKEKDKQYLKLDGTAVFKDRRVVGSLNEAESRGYRYMSSKMITDGLITFPSPFDTRGSASGNVISLELIRSQAKVTPEFDGRNITKIIIKIEAEGNFYEQTTADQILSLDKLKVMEQAADKQIRNDVQASINQAQLLQSDIFGWGQVVYQENPDLWSRLEANWPAVFAGIETEVTADFKIRRTYLLDKSFEFR